MTCFASIAESMLLLLLLLHCSSSLTNDHVGVLVIDLSSSCIICAPSKSSTASAGCVKMKTWVRNFMAHTVE